jgi:hypothetical protein
LIQQFIPPRCTDFHPSAPDLLKILSFACPTLSLNWTAWATLAATSTMRLSGIPGPGAYLKIHGDNFYGCNILQFCSLNEIGTSFLTHPQGAGPF